MRIGLDFDGVLADCGRLKSNGAKELFGVEIPPAKFKKEIVVGEGHLTLGQYRHLQATIYGTRDMGLRMDPVDGMLEYLPRLVADGHSILIVTSRGNNETSIAREWAQGLKLDLEFNGIGYHQTKAEAARGLDFFVDDDLDKLEALVGIVPNRYLFSWDYNAHIETGSVATRIGSWAELYRTIRDFRGV